tara:strand:- start:4546 stop:4857 length:312 start_codon:yes stop_codon:yes gene_type:complete
MFISNYYNNNNSEFMKKIKTRWISILRTMVRDRRLSPVERLATRLGYMGAGFLIAAQWTVEPILFIMGFCCVLVQVIARRQWNLVILQLNGLIAWTIHFINLV